MNKATPASFEDVSRADARAFAQSGIAALARAVNLLGAQEVPFRYAQDVHKKLFSLSVEMVRLVEYGDIEPNPEHALYLGVLRARNDKTLQALLKKAAKRRPRSTQVFKGQSS